jgi:hypothetical protein
MTLHLTRDSTMTMTIGDIMDKFNLPYLCGALADSLDRVNNGQPKIGGRRAADTNTPLPFDHLQVWTKVQLQNRPYHTPHHIIPPQTINALPPSEAWTSGRCDVVFINTDNKVWPHSGLEGVSSSCKPVSSTNFPTRFQGIISPICVLFFVPSHPEEPEILLVQIYFSCMLSVSILYLSCLQLAKDNRTRRVCIRGHQLGCIF